MNTTESTLHTIFFEVCGERSDRYDLSQPYAWGGFMYATNGHIMVRCKRVDFGTDFCNGKVPDPSKITGDDGVPRRLLPIPECNESKPCDACDGSGLITSGLLECECGECFQIKLNGQNLAYDCLECAAKGSQPNDEAILVAESPKIYFQARYLALIRRHGVREFNVPFKYPDIATFSGDGFEGWLMPMDTKQVERELQIERDLSRKQ